MKIMILLILVSSNSFAKNEESEFFRALRLSCEKQKVALGCFNYANTLLRAGNEELANKYFELGCKQNHTPSCSKEKWDTPINKPEPVPESIQEPVPESTQEPVPESTQEPVPESTQEPMPESTQEPMPESTTDAVDLSLDVGNTINE